MFDWDLIVEMAAKAAHEAHWGSLPQHEDTIRCPKCNGGVLVTGWQNVGIAYCINSGRVGLSNYTPPTCDWSSHVKWDGKMARAVDAPDDPKALGSCDVFAQMAAAFRGAT